MPSGPCGVLFENHAKEFNQSFSKLRPEGALAFRDDQFTNSFSGDTPARLNFVGLVGLEEPAFGDAHADPVGVQQGGR